MMLKNYQVRTQTYCRQKMKEKVDREETQTRLFTTLHGFLDTFFEVSREPTCLCDEQTAAAPREENRRKDAQTPKGEGERGKMPVDKGRRCNEPKEARVLKCLFEFLAKWPSVRSAGHSSQPESNEITRIYILWFTSLSSAFACSFASRRPRLPRPRATWLVLSFVSSSIPLLLPPRLANVLLFVHRAVGEITNSLFMGIVTNNPDIREIWNNLFRGRLGEVRWRLYRKGGFSFNLT